MTKVDHPSAMRRRPASPSSAPGQHGVVPVHGELDLRCESARVVGHGMAEPTCRQLPVRAVLGQAFRDRHATSQRVVDGGRSREQCVALGPAGRVERPQNRAVRLLPAQDEVDPLLNRRPQLAQELHVPGDQVVVPGAGRQVGAHVRVEAGVLDGVTLVVVEPAAVGELAGGEPPVGIDRLVHESADGERHRGLDVIPRVAVATDEPGDHPVASLHLRDGVCRGQDVRARQDAGHLGQRDGGADLFGRHAAAPWVGLVGPRRPGTPRGRSGRASGSPATVTSGFLR